MSIRTFDRPRDIITDILEELGCITFTKVVQDDLMKEFEGFSLELRELCSLAEDVKLWSLASKDPPTIFHRGKLCLIGDAAHPMLPRKLPPHAET